jgi:hypothetical protein
MCVHVTAGAPVAVLSSRHCRRQHWHGVGASIPSPVSSCICASLHHHCVIVVTTGSASLRRCHCQWQWVIGSGVAASLSRRVGVAYRSGVASFRASAHLTNARACASIRCCIVASPCYGGVQFDSLHWHVPSSRRCVAALLPACQWVRRCGFASLASLRHWQCFDFKTPVAVL